jgi:hypothetical protein
MQRVLVLGARTYFRVWMMQPAPQNRDEEHYWCANYQLFVSAKSSTLDTSQQRKLNKQLRCHAEELPATLNSPRYLDGQNNEQKDFHYRQSYRVDHLWHNQAHKMAFKLKEPTLVRILAPIHRHLEFELVLNQEYGAYSHKTVVRAKKEDHHTGIFAMLDPGDYHLKIDFFSDAALLQLPCQTLLLEFAMMSDKRVLLQYKALKEASEKPSVQENKERALEHQLFN